MFALKNYLSARFDFQKKSSKYSHIGGNYLNKPRPIIKISCADIHKSKGWDYFIFLNVLGWIFTINNIN